MLSEAYLKSLLRYDPDTGQFFWKEARGRVRKEDVAGTVDAHGRRVIKIDGKRYYDNVLAWCYMTGAWPLNDVDHQDRDTLNCRWANLRHVSHRENAVFAAPSRELPVGVRASGKRFQARMWLNKKVKTLGTFDTPEQAHKAYLLASKEA